ncbi:MAG: flagellar basal body protein FliL [Alphaproteobacteria bacterium]|nr:flagellar basal body protein FliL [Alphaproteobacteria bacterium]
MDAEIDIDDDIDAPKKGLTGKKIVLFIVLPILLLGGIGGGLMMTGMLGGGDEEAAKAETKTAKPKPIQTVFFDLPEMLVNLNGTGRRQNFLKMQVSLELTDEAVIPELKKLSPRIVDNFQVYLRELRVEDLRGSAGVYRLREELVARVNVAVRPVEVKDVLFKEMLIQ